MKRVAHNRIKCEFGAKKNRLTYLLDLPSPKNKRFSLFICDCGTLKSYQFTSWNTETVVSCGCYKNEMARNRLLTHGLTGTPIHNSWRAMVARCCDVNNDFYHTYGGNDITVCERWLESFENFLEDMGSSWAEGRTIDRIDNSKGYYPENCKWSTASEQCINRRKFKNNTSGKTGVYREGNKWRACIGIKGEFIYLGIFQNLEDAVAARESAEIKYFGFNKE